VDIGSHFESNSPPSVLMKPRVRALNDPAVDAEPAAVSFPSACDHRLDASEFQSDPMRLRVLGAARIEAYGTKSGMTDAALDRGDLFNDGDELSHVVGVRGGRLLHHAHVVAIEGHSYRNPPGARKAG